MVKLVREFLYEFERGLDPKAAMNIGIISTWKKYLQDNEISSFEKLTFIKEKISEGYIKSIIFLLEELIKINDYENLESVLRHYDSYIILLKEVDNLYKYDKFAKWMMEDYGGEWSLPKIKSGGALEQYYNLAFKIWKPQTAWKNFIDKKDSEGMIKALDKGANAKSGRIKPYIVAIDNKNIELLKRLLKKGVSPSEGFPRQGKTEYNYPLRRAAFKNFVEGVKLLISDPRVDPSDHNNSALAGAVRNNFQEIIDILLSNKRVISNMENTPRTIKSKLGIK